MTKGWIIAIVLGIVALVIGAVIYFQKSVVTPTNALEIGEGVAANARAYWARLDAYGATHPTNPQTRGDTGSMSGGAGKPIGGGTARGGA